MARLALRHRSTMDGMEGNQNIESVKIPRWQGHNVSAVGSNARDAVSCMFTPDSWSKQRE